MPIPRPMLEAIKLTKTYDGVPAVDHLGLKIEPGEIFCLLGPLSMGVDLWFLRTSPCSIKPGQIVSLSKPTRRGILF